MSTTTTLEIFRDLAPEFVSETDDKINRFISYAEAEVSQNIFGENIDYQKAIAYLAASKLKVIKAAISTNIAGSGGSIIGKKAGNMEIRYGAVHSNLANCLIDNVYLDEFQRLIGMYRNKEILIIDALSI